MQRSKRPQQFSRQRPESLAAWSLFSKFSTFANRGVFRTQILKSAGGQRKKRKSRNTGREVEEGGRVVPPKGRFWN
ncbi:hypothetical protein H8959_020770 [Pygathrix nigripes]